MTRAVRLRVAIITPELNRDGATELAVAEQVERWCDRFDITLYTMAHAGVDVSGVRVRRILRPPGPHLLRYLWWLVANRVARWWDERAGLKYDVVHSPGMNALDADAVGVHIVFAKHWEGVRTAMRTGATQSAGVLRRMHRRVYWALVRALEARLYAGPATLWALSRADAGVLEAMGHRASGSVPVVPYGVDAERFGPARRAAHRDRARLARGWGDERVLLLVGNDLQKKGLDRALAALALLPASYRLAVAGRESAHVHAMVGAALCGRVIVLPFTSEIETYYAAADCLIAPSREDAFHLPALEALASGLPVVASDEMGASETLAAAMTVVRNADDAAALAAAVMATFDDAPATAARVVRGRTYALDATWAKYAERTAALVEREAITPRVLVLAPDAGGIGGVQLATQQLIEGLAARYGTARVGLLALRAHGTALPCVALSDERAFTLRAVERISPVRKLQFAWRAIRAARRWRGRRGQLVIVACHAHLAPVARLCSRLTGMPYVVWAHGIEVHASMSGSARAALAAADTVVAGSGFTQRVVSDILGAGGREVRTIHYSMSPSRADVRSSAANEGRGAAVRVLSVARLVGEHAYKGVDALIMAWPRVLASVPSAELVIVGDGDDRARLERIATRLQLGSRVQFLGRVSEDELTTAYASATVFALPGRAAEGFGAAGEGFGLVFLEAAAHGLPTIAGRAGGSSEAVEDGVTGTVVNGESSRDIAHAIVQLLTTPALAHAFGQAGVERTRREFSPRRFSDAWESVIASLAAPGASSVAAGGNS